MELSVPDSDLEIWGGVGHPGEVGGNRSPKIFFSALRASVSSKNKGGGLPSGSATAC